MEIPASIVSLFNLYFYHFVWICFHYVIILMRRFTDSCTANVMGLDSRTLASIDRARSLNRTDPRIIGTRNDKTIVTTSLINTPYLKQNGDRWNWKLWRTVTFLGQALNAELAYRLSVQPDAMWINELLYCVLHLWRINLVWFNQMNAKYKFVRS